MENERDLNTIQSVFTIKQTPVVERQSRSDVQRKRIQYALSQLGMAGEKGAKDIMDMCMYLLDRHQQVCQVGVGALCAQLSDSPKSMEQRARRAVERGLNHLASLGLDDYGNEVFTQYASRLFPFRTRQLSSFLLTILGWRRPGKIGSANTERPHRLMWPFFVAWEASFCNIIKWSKEDFYGGPTVLSLMWRQKTGCRSAM
uniref:DNA-binding domain-containing protein n=1 Tax=Dysosmobacter welbionis TaxID=2093857 RepID=UPI003FEDB075